MHEALKKSNVIKSYLNEEFFFLIFGVNEKD